MNLEGYVNVTVAIVAGKIDMNIEVADHLSKEEAALILEAAARGLRSKYADEFFNQGPQTQGTSN